MKNLFIDTTAFDVMLAPGYKLETPTRFVGFVRPGREFILDVPDSELFDTLGAKRFHAHLNQRVCRSAVALLLHYVGGYPQDKAHGIATDKAFDEDWQPKVEAVFAEYAARPLEDFPAYWQEHMK